MKLWLVILSLIAANPHASSESGALDAFHWLEGDWERETSAGPSVESWIRVSDSTMEGTATVGEGDASQVFEFLRLEVFGEETFYTAKPRQNVYPTSFKLVASGDGRWTFENPAHDFPQRIIYSRPAEDQLVVRIETMDGEQGRDFRFVRRSTQERNSP